MNAPNADESNGDISEENAHPRRRGDALKQRRTGEFRAAEVPER